MVLNPQMNMELASAIPRRITVSRGYWKRAFVFGVLLLSSGAFSNLFWNEDLAFDPGKGMGGMQVIWALIYTVTVVLLWREKSSPLRLLWGNKLLLVLILLPFVSVAWSAAPSVTLRRSVGVAGASLFSLLLVSQFELREELDLLSAVFSLSAASSLVFGWFHIGWSVDSLEGAWYGVYTQKNILGTMMTVAGLVFLLRARIRPESRTKSKLCALLTFILVLLSRSATAVLVFTLVLGLFVALPRLRQERSRAKKSLVVLVGIVVILGIVVASQFENLTYLVGRDPGLTGRAELWSACILMGLDRPWTGYGFDAFWLGREGDSAEVWQLVGWKAPSAHNGLLELWLNLGAFGVLVGIIVFGQSLWRAFFYFRRGVGWERAWPFLLLIGLFFFNVTESFVVSSNGFMWILFVSAALRLWSEQKKVRNPEFAVWATPKFS